MDRNTYGVVERSFAGHRWHELHTESVVKVSGELGLSAHPIRFDSIINRVPHDLKLEDGLLLFSNCDLGTENCFF